MSQKLYFNGINGTTGGYLTPPLTPEQVSKIAQGKPLDEGEVRELRSWFRFRSAAPFPVKEGVNPDDLAQSGWGIIFASEDNARVPAYKEALSELLALRHGQAGDLYQEYTGPDAYRKGESKRAFLERHGVGPGPVDPAVVPYYLLIVGDPETIPYHIQYQLDVQYAVGRIHFYTLEEYAQYARSVVSAEQGGLKLKRQATFFGVKNPGDPATSLGATELAKPLAAQIKKEQKAWSVETFLADKATKEQLSRLLGGDETPALLFTESHGIGFPNGDPCQLRHQGALLCQDWPGPNAWHQPITEDHYFSGDDVGSDAKLLGLMAFFFACFGAGTPRRDNFTFDPDKPPAVIAPRAFMSRLPQQLIGHPNGGALAVVGHVDRAWSYSFIWGSAGRQLEVFNSMLQALMNGRPIGAALEHFNLRYAELATDVTDILNDIRHGAAPDDLEVAGLWTAHNDARSYAIIGDPAVRLPIAREGSQPSGRETIAPLTITTEFP